MSTPDVGDAPEPADVGGSAPAGALFPDAGAIERLANAFFKGLTSGAPLGAPADTGVAACAVVDAGAAFGFGRGERNSRAAAVRRAGHSDKRPSVFGSVPLVRRGVGRLRLALRLPPVASGRAGREPDGDRGAARRSACVAGMHCRFRTRRASAGPPRAVSLAPLSPFSALIDLSAALGALNFAVRPARGAAQLGWRMRRPPRARTAPIRFPAKPGANLLRPPSRRQPPPSGAITPRVRRRQSRFGRLRRGHDSQRFSDPSGKSSRKKADLARQWRDHAKAAGGDRPARVLLRAREFERSSRRPYAGCARDRRLRGGARQGAALHRRFVPARDRVRARRDGRDQSGRAGLGPPQRERGRRDRRDLARTPRQHRALAAALSRDRARGCASRRSTTTATSCSTNTRSCSARAPASSRCRRSRTRWAR